MEERKKEELDLDELMRRYKSPADSANSILKNVQNNLRKDFEKIPLSSQFFRVDAAIDLLKTGEPTEKIMLKGNWVIDSRDMNYLRNWEI